MEVHVISFTEAGFSLAKKIPCESSVFIHDVRLSEWVGNHFKKGNCLVFVGAAGIAVRAVAPFVRDKKEDAAVIVIDEKGRFVIPVLSGHIGGANDAARKIAERLGAEPVITTASDVNGIPAIDEFAAKNDLSINDMSLAKLFAAKMLAGKEPEFSVSPYIKKDVLNLIPRCVILGIGCKKGKGAAELEDFVRKTLVEHKIDLRSVLKITSIDIKKEENALVSLAEVFSVPFETFSADELNRIPQEVSHSDFVSKITGTDNVCERAVFAGGADFVAVPKTSHDGMTLAVGIKKPELEIPDMLRQRICDII